MDAPALYCLVDALAQIEIDMRSGHWSFAKVRERHAALCVTADAAADATNMPLRPRRMIPQPIIDLTRHAIRGGVA